ncbi:hypothetical protein BOS5A_200751 [Bosea sp. EC-HK365B]|nr:hypothetical protein BOSE21B_110702 [Bosea sp. 21B]VVT58769.1 hypothetical protein BOS5A_200751 [Bosea sp. EC-HK365B]VXC79977.1 hypothetical protein BOSE127_50221 [Bosea sp. 127]
MIRRDGAFLIPPTPVAALNLGNEPVFDEAILATRFPEMQSLRVIIFLKGTLSGLAG